MRTTRRNGSCKGGKGEADDENRELVLKKHGQEYAQVLRMLGNGRCEAMCIDGTKRICRFRARRQKKMWIDPGDIVLVDFSDYKDEKVIFKYMPDKARLLKARGELPESSRLNGGITGGLDEEDEGAGKSWFERNPHDIKTSELLPQAEIKETKGNDSSPPAKKQKKNKDSSPPLRNTGLAAKKQMVIESFSSTPNIDDDLTVSVESEVRPDLPGHDIPLRDDPFNKFGIEMSQYIHSQEDADYYASLSLPNFMKHFHNQVMIINRMASHLGHSTNKPLLQKEDLESKKKFDFAKKDALKRIRLLQEEVATVEAARDRAILIAGDMADALEEFKDLLSDSTEETTGLKVEIAELKKLLEESRASTSTKLSPEERQKLLKEGFEIFRKGARRQPFDPAEKAIIEELDFDTFVKESDFNSDS